MVPSDYNDLMRTGAGRYPGHSFLFPGKCILTPIMPRVTLRLILETKTVRLLEHCGNATVLRWMPALAGLVLLQFSSGCGGGSASPAISTPTPPVSTVAVSPTSPSMGVGANLQFSATISGNSSTAVNWQVNGSQGGSTSTGTIDTTGFYIAPVPAPTSGTVTITAVSQADSTQTATTNVTLMPTDPLGNVPSYSTIACPGVTTIGTPPTTSACYSLDVSCPYVADFTTYLKVNLAAGTAVGTVMFGTGTGGMTLYDSTWTFGINVIENVLNAGFNTVQVAFGGPFTNAPLGKGWLTGPGGVRRLACRYATVAQWVYQNIHNSNASAPFCATGNSAGSAAITYSVAHYGLDSIFAFIEPTSGPPLARLDYACIGNGVSLPTPCGQGMESPTFLPGDAMIVDPAYSAPICTQSLSGSTTYEAQLLSDSVDGPGAIFSYPHTGVNIVFGGLDATVAVPQALEWFIQVSSPNGPPAPACVADAPHEMPMVLDAADLIASDMISMCKLQ